jgi:hypothetical protein
MRMLDTVGIAIAGIRSQVTTLNHVVELSSRDWWNVGPPEDGPL